MESVKYAMIVQLEVSILNHFLNILTFPLILFCMLETILISKLKHYFKTCTLLNLKSWG